LGDKLQFFNHQPLTTTQLPMMSNAESTPILKPATPSPGAGGYESHQGIPKGLKLAPGAQEIRHFEHICS
jgi:hypothetical protein